MNLKRTNIIQAIRLACTEWFHDSMMNSKQIFYLNISRFVSFRIFFFFSQESNASIFQVMILFTPFASCRKKKFRISCCSLKAKSKWWKWKEEEIVRLESNCRWCDFDVCLFFVDFCGFKLKYFAFHFFSFPEWRAKYWRHDKGTKRISLDFVFVLSRLSIDRMQTENEMHWDRARAVFMREGGVDCR